MGAIDINNIHLINRLTFGPSIHNVDRYIKKSPKDLIKILLKDSEKCKRIKTPFRKLFTMNDLRGVKKGKDRIKMKRKMKKCKQIFNTLWLEEMAHGKSQLREKISLFWHDHFATDVPNPIKAADQINLIRKLALGSFADLLVAVSQHPSMIDYLNNKQNVKGQPNENFAREILELFTIGRGNYTEKDIQEAARAFTGWTYDSEGKFYVDQSLHDDGVKVFMGKQGRFTGHDIIQIILTDKRTAAYIASKLYYYIAGVPIDQRRLIDLVNVFYPNYNIGELLVHIIANVDFFSQEKIGTRVKSPIELLVGIMRILNVRFKGTTLAYKLQLKMDQVLLSPPNVSGWRSGRDWINSGSITDRLNLAHYLYHNEVSNIFHTDDISQEGDAVIALNEEDDIAQFELKPVIDWINQQARGDLQVFGEMLFSCNFDQIRIRIDEVQTKVRMRKMSGTDAILSFFSYPEYQMN